MTAEEALAQWRDRRDELTEQNRMRGHSQRIFTLISVLDETFEEIFGQIKATEERISLLFEQIQVMEERVSFLELQGGEKA